jgi:hypothetical protein
LGADALNFLRRSTHCHAYTQPVHGELLNWSQSGVFSGFDSIPGGATSLSFLFI